MFLDYQRIARTIIILVSTVGVTNSATIKKEITCYVCRPSRNYDNIEALENLKSLSYDVENIPTCGSNAARNFTLKCPNGYKGCLTKTYGKHVLKTCNKFEITDCKVANNVKYCFCDQSLCNNATTSTQIPVITDDEDDSDQWTEEGSGSFESLTPLDSHTPKHTKNKTSVSVILNNNTPVIQKNTSLETLARKPNPTENKTNNSIILNNNNSVIQMNPSSKSLAGKIPLFNIIETLSFVLLIYKLKIIL